MKILTLISVLACGIMISAHGQSFTNSINLFVPDGKQSLSVSYNDHSHQTISNPIDLFVDLTVFGATDITSLNATLQHKGTTFDVFSFGEPVSSGLYVFPTSDFVGQDGQGSWNLTLIDNNKDNVTVTLNRWGITSVPEPSSISLILLGFAGLFLIQKRNRTHENS